MRQRFVTVRGKSGTEEGETMAFCPKCGSTVADGVAFCPGCGAAQGGAAMSPSAAPGAPAAAQSQMDEKVAGLLCYVLGWVTGLIFYFIDKRPYVRFHAAQSIVVFGGLHVLSIIVGMFFGISLLSGGLSGFSIGYAFYGLLNIVVLVLWILLMVKAYQGDRFRVPVAADIAEKLFGKA
jgi:uncharacterized membrane protein